MIIDIYDNVLEEHNAMLIDDAVKKLSWKYDYPSEPSKPDKHWHVFCGHNEEECIEAGYDWAHEIFSFVMNKLDFKNKYNVEKYVRIYCNAHTYGVEPAIHMDDGDFTMIYYPRLDWKLEWGGGTFVYDEEKTRVEKLAEYKGNRLIVFDAWRPHQAQSVRRECYELRTCVVFKTNISGASRERLDFYKD